MNELEISTDQTVGIETGRLAALVTDLDGVFVVFAYSVALLLLPKNPLPLVSAIFTNEFSAHSVGKDVGTTIIVARDSIRTTVSSFSLLPAAHLASKGGGGMAIVHVFALTTDLRSTTIDFVGHAGVAKGHVVAGLAPESRDGCVSALVCFPIPWIKDFASVAALGILGLCVAGWTGRTRARRYGCRCCFGFANVGRDKPPWIFQSCAVPGTELLAEVPVGIICFVVGKAI